MTTQGKKFTCFICGYMSLDSRCEWDICPICFWEDDVLVCTDEDDRISSANGLSVSEAQANYIEFGAIEKRFLDKVRKPLPNEKHDKNWTPLARALERVRQDRGDLGD